MFYEEIMQPRARRAFRRFFKKHFTIVGIQAPYILHYKYFTLSCNIEMLVNIPPFRIKSGFLTKFCCLLLLHVLYREATEVKRQGVIYRPKYLNTVKRR
jgi:hypothetical protein